MSKSHKMVHRAISPPTRFYILCNRRATLMYPHLCFLLAEMARTDSVHVVDNDGTRLYRPDSSSTHTPKTSSLRRFVPPDRRRDPYAVISRQSVTTGRHIHRATA